MNRRRSNRVWNAIAMIIMIIAAIAISYLIVVSLSSPSGEDDATTTATTSTSPATAATTAAAGTTTTTAITTATTAAATDDATTTGGSPPPESWLYDETSDRANANSRVSYDLLHVWHGTPGTWGEKETAVFERYNAVSRLFPDVAAISDHIQPGTAKKAAVAIKSWPLKRFQVDMGWDAHYNVYYNSRSDSFSSKNAVNAFRAEGYDIPAPERVVVGFGFDLNGDETVDVWVYYLVECFNALTERQVVKNVPKPGRPATVTTTAPQATTTKAATTTAAQATTTKAATTTSTSPATTTTTTATTTTRGGGGGGGGGGGHTTTTATTTTAQTTTPSTTTTTSPATTPPKRGTEPTPEGSGAANRDRVDDTTRANDGNPPASAGQTESGGVASPIDPDTKPGSPGGDRATGASDDVGENRREIPAAEQGLAPTTAPTTQPPPTTEGQTTAATTTTTAPANTGTVSGDKDKI